MPNMLAGTVLAARWHGPGDVRVEPVPALGAPRAGWVRLDVEACGICGTDVEEYTSGPVVIPITPHELSGQCAPLTLGHEAVGVVTATGDGVDLPVGTRVAIEANVFCGSCYWCGRREFQLCERLASLGLMADGGLAEQMLAPAYMCVPIEAHVPPESAALAEPLSVAVRAVRRAGIGPGSSVGVVGAGTVGLLAVQAARIAGADLVVAVERHAQRRQLALKLGADVALGPDDDLQAVTAELTGGVGLDRTIEAAGSPAAAATTIRLVRRGGRAVLLGVYDDVVPLDMMDFLFGEKEVVASLSHVYDVDFVEAVRMIETGAVEVQSLITDRIPLADVVHGGFERLVAEPDAHLKFMVFPGGLG